MAHQRNQLSMGDSLKSPHSVSLKVLRLSRPSLATQYPLPNSQELGISPKASLAYPSDANKKDKFILSPVLNLPEAFGSAYVGETFSCTLCANNELLPSDSTRSVSGVRIQGDMQTPSNPTGSPLDLSGADGELDGAVSPAPGESLQRILRFELKEEGNHVLAVTVTYTETALGEGKASGGRVRTFRKLYQFVAQQLLSVRTKAGELSKRDGMSRYLLEAQLENMGEAAVCLEVCRPTFLLCLQTPLHTRLDKLHRSLPCSCMVAAINCIGPSVLHALLADSTPTFHNTSPYSRKHVKMVANTEQAVTVNPKPPLVSASLSWDMPSPGSGQIKAPILTPRDVIQVAFLLDEQPHASESRDEAATAADDDSRKVLGQLAIQWRSALGDRGSLSTGWLTSRR